MKYKNIIFDLGAVILNIDFQRTIDAFIALGISNFDTIFSATVQSDLFDKFDKGLITSKKFRKDLIAFSGKQISDKDFDFAWNAMIIDFPENRINYIQELRKQYSIFLLSNTNAIHYPIYNSLLSKNFGISDISTLFSNTYLSFQVGMRKPQLEIFHLVLDENSLNPSETLFVDDNEENIIAAQKIGIKSYLLKSPFTIEKDLNEVLQNY
jgi:glucose-1-phosphatase